MEKSASNTLPIVLALAAGLCLAGCDNRQQQTEIKSTGVPNDWLLNAKDDLERLQALQTQLRGLDVAMWEVGERYRHLHEALSRGNYDLAIYHWEKIKTASENAIVRRPARRANAEALFLNELWQRVHTGIASRDAATAWAAFEAATESCKACHIAEKVAHMNDQPMFELQRPIPAP